MHYNRREAGSSSLLPSEILLDATEFLMQALLSGKVLKFKLKHVLVTGALSTAMALERLPMRDLLRKLT